MVFIICELKTNVEFFDIVVSQALLIDFINLSVAMFRQYIESMLLKVNLGIRVHCLHLRQNEFVRPLQHLPEPDPYFVVYDRMTDKNNRYFMANTMAQQFGSKCPSCEILLPRRAEYGRKI